MQKRRLSSVLLVVLAGLLVEETTAAPDDSPKNFFPKNYASGSAPVDKSARTPSVSSVSGKEGGTSKQLSRRDESHETPKGDSMAAGLVDGPSTQEEKPPSIVLVYANSKNREHFNRAVQAVVRVSSSGKVRVVGLLHIGDYANVTSQHEADLQRAGVVVQGVPMLPEDLDELNSPVWEVRTGDEVAYLSGVFDVQRFFSKDGRLQLVDEEAEIKPTQRMDGF